MPIAPANQTKRRVDSSATFATLGEAQAARFSGTAVSDANRSFLRGD